MIRRVYLSGALTGLEDPQALKSFYEALGAVCAQAGIQAYIPHLATDPLKFPHFSARDVYDLDRSQVLASDLLIAYIGVPSLGVGMELEIAHQAGIPVLLLAESGVPLSRMARGCPAVIAEILYSDQEEALQKLKDWLLDPGNQLLVQASEPNPREDGSHAHTAEAR